MKIIAYAILMIVSGGFMVQESLIPSGLYSWNSMKPDKPVLSGNTTFMTLLEISVEKLKPGEKRKKSVAGADVEELLIIKEGQLSSSVDDKKKPMGAGSIIFLTPGQIHTCENKGTTPAVFYSLKYKGRRGTDAAKGKDNGGSFVVHWDELPFKPSNVGGRRDFFNRPTASTSRFEMHVTTLNEGVPSHAPHEHDEEEIILLMKGNATMTIEGKEYSMAPGDFVFAASHDFHGIRNTGSGQCEYFAFQWK